jgi:hypothetical protein
VYLLSAKTNYNKYLASLPRTIVYYWQFKLKMPCMHADERKVKKANENYWNYIYQFHDTTSLPISITSTSLPISITSTSLPISITSASLPISITSTV